MLSAFKEWMNCYIQLRGGNKLLIIIDGVKRKLATVKRFKAKQLFRVANLRYQLCSVDNTKLLL